jgi:hypothetical protein
MRQPVVVRRAGCERGPGPGHCGHFAPRPETVEVLGVRAQTAGDRVHAVRVGLPGQLHTGRHQRGERLGRGHLPLDGDIGVRQAAVPVSGQRVRGQPGPQHHAGGVRLARGPEMERVSPACPGPGAVAPTPPQRPRPGHRARSCAAAGVPSPAQYGRHLNSDHGCGTIMRGAPGADTNVGVLSAYVGTE